MKKNISYNWIDWWKAETITREITWQKNMEIFIRATDPLLNYDAHDRVLDIGCGPGYLAAFLKDRVKEIHCLDTSARYLDICRKKFKQDENVFSYKLDENHYTDLSFLKPKKFSIIICLSVIQYYKNLSDVENLIEEVRSIALSGARFLIADIPTSSGAFSDIFGLLITGFREKYLLESLQFLYRTRTSDYPKFRSSNGLLVLSVEKLREIIDKLNLDAEVVKIPMTTNRYRKHLLIKF